jgi:hypothetical protein
MTSTSASAPIVLIIAMLLHIHESPQPAMLAVPVKPAVLAFASLFTAMLTAMQAAMVAASALNVLADLPLGLVPEQAMPQPPTGASVDATHCPAHVLVAPVS